MKPRLKNQRREIFVLTPEEKSTLCFVVAALVLGLGAKHYRDTHSTPLAKTGVVETAKTTGLPPEKRAEAKRRKAAR
jgi:hypothetical protein